MISFIMFVIGNSIVFVGNQGSIHDGFSLDCQPAFGSKLGIVVSLFYGLGNSLKQVK